MSTIGSPFTPTATKVLFCGAGELGKEVVIELKRLGVEVIACDRYPNAPAMQVADRAYSFSIADLRLFGKPEVHGRRRMGVALARGADIEEARAKARRAAAQIRVELDT